MITPIEIDLILSKILESPDFKDARKYQDLLTYLAKASSKGEHIKEITIAHEIFGKNSNFDPSEDPSIRVYISNLRKKLEHYYLTTNDIFPYKIDIPKGHYLVKFTPFQSKINTNRNSKYQAFFYLPVIVVLIIIILIQFFYKKPENISERDFTSINPVWSEFLQRNSLPTMIVLGDYLFLYEKNKSLSGGYFVRDARINSEEDYRQLIRQNPDLINQFSILNFTYLRPSATWSYAEVLKILNDSPNKIILKLASQFKWEDFQSHNVVFIGSFKTLYELNKYFPKLNIKYNAYPPLLNILDENGDTLETFDPHDLVGGNYQKDYGVILKQRGPNDNNILFLMGFDEVGIIEASKTSTDPNFVSKIKERYKIEQPDSSWFFELVIETEGIHQTGFESKIKFFRMYGVKL